jgi:hypothetical protein
MRDKTIKKRESGVSQGEYINIMYGEKKNLFEV